MQILSSGDLHPLDLKTCGWSTLPLRRVLRIGGMRKDAKAEKVLNS
jgi:hypothetical protein